MPTSGGTSGTPIPGPGTTTTTVTGNCTGRFAEAWQYAAFWCTSSLLYGTHKGGLASATLNDTQATFVSTGIRANVGMILHNITQATSGPITSVDENNLVATGVAWNTNDRYRVSTLTGAEQSQIEMYLDITASDLHAVLAARNACDCTLATWALTLLAKINIVESGVFHECPCGRPELSSEDRANYLAWVNTQMDLIRTGKLELCAGATGAEYPAVDWAEQSVTEFNAAKIVVNH